MKKRTKVTVCWIVKWVDPLPGYRQYFSGCAWVAHQCQARRYYLRADAVSVCRGRAYRKVVRIVRRVG